MKMLMNVLYLGDYGFIVSFGYRHIIQQEVIEFFPNRIVNLHISLLPWNRGADPNVWSFLTKTPKGVTIHHMDKGIDTGRIIAQKELDFPDKSLTLRQTYDALQEAIVTLFIRQWPFFKKGRTHGLPQGGGGSVHTLKQRVLFQPLLEAKGWETPVSLVEDYGERLPLRRD